MIPSVPGWRNGLLALTIAFPTLCVPPRSPSGPAAGVTTAAPQASDWQQEYVQGERHYAVGTADELRIAQGYFERALKLCIAEGNTQCQLGGLIHLAAITNQLEDWPLAQQYARQTFDLATTLHNQRYQASALSMLSVAMAKNGSYGEALRRGQEAVDIYRQLPDAVPLAKALQNLAILEGELGDAPNAQGHLLEAVGLYRRAGDRTGEAAALSELATAYQMSDPRTALDYIHKAIAIDSQTANNDRILAVDLNKRSIIRWNLQDVQGSWDDLERAAGLFRALHDSASEGATLADLGLRAEAIGSCKQALPYYQRALQLIGPAAESERLWRVHRGIGACLWKEGQLQQAESELRLAITLIEKLRSSVESDTLKVSYFDTKQMVYGDLVELLFDRDKPNEALEVAEAGRARAFADLLSKAAIATRPEGTIALAQIRQVASRNNAYLLEYFVTPRGLATWLVSPDGTVFGKLQLFEKQPSDEIKRLRIPVTNLRVALGVEEWQVSRSSRGSRSEPARAEVSLSEQVRLATAELSPLLFPTEIAAHFNPGKGTILIIIPHGELFLVPFALVKDGAGRLLIDRCPLSYSPSINVLDETDRRHGTRRFATSFGLGDVLLMGNPQMPVWRGSQLPSLPGAQQEVTELSTKLRTRGWIGENATEKRFKAEAGSRRILHLATHGVADPEKPMESFVALAPTQDDDGLLTAAEVTQLHLNADLVVLSACQSGLGKVSGDGVVGLSRAFIGAGADSILVSLWKVDDQKTAAFMQAFYDSFLSGKTKAEALGEAMRAQRAKWNDPQDWAAFILIGEPR